MRENFQTFLKARPGLEPFCYWFGPTNCHRKWIAGSGQALWKINPDDLKGRLPPYLPDVPEIRQDVADYFGEIQAFDAAVGVLLDELEKTGQLDNTMIIVSGDHGMPGVPHGKCNLYDFGTQVSLAIRWPKEIPAGRVIDDFISLPDLAPTLVNAAGLEPPSTMTGKSLLTVLRSSKSGQVDPQRDHIVVGRERHVNTARTDNLPYPQRALRTEKYLYIRNFKPDRWPMGTAVGFGAEAGDMPGVTDLTENTFAAFADMDASPTKAWLVTHRDDPKYKALFEATFGLRPEEELYDLTVDPHQMQNVAADPKYQEIKRQQSDRLMKILQDSGDPRVTGAGDTFDLPPYTTGER